jgi:hypothetical protein
MIFGINWVLFSIISLPGAGISDLCMASAEPSSKRREMRVLNALRRNPTIIRLITTNIMVPRRIVLVWMLGSGELGILNRAVRRKYLCCTYEEEEEDGLVYKFSVRANCALSREQKQGSVFGSTVGEIR